MERSMPILIPDNVQKSTCDIFMMLLYCMGEDEQTRHKMQHLFDQFLESLVWRVQTEDEYEPDPTDVQHIGSDGITIEWNEMNWSVDAMIMLLVDADKVAEKQAFLLKYNNSDDVDHSDIAVIAEYQRFQDIQENSYTTSFLNDPQLGDYDVRQFLKRYLFWLAIYLDTRCERLACKANNVLVRLEIGWPAPVKVRNIRRALEGALLQYAYGYCSPAEFEDILRDAYAIGYFIDHIPDMAADDVDKDCIFEAESTKFEPGPSPYLVLRGGSHSDEERDNNDEDVVMSY